MASGYSFNPKKMLKIHLHIHAAAEQFCSKALRWFVIPF